MKTKLIVLLLLAILPFIASSQVTLTPIQADNLVRLINDYESIKERHTIVIGRLTEAEEIIWKYGDMINECDNIRKSCEEKLSNNYEQLQEMDEQNQKLQKKIKRNRIISSISTGVLMIITYICIQ